MVERLIFFYSLILPEPHGWMLSFRDQCRYSQRTSVFFSSFFSSCVDCRRFCAYNINFWNSFEFSLVHCGSPKRVIKDNETDCYLVKHSDEWMECNKCDLQGARNPNFFVLIMGALFISLRRIMQATKVKLYGSSNQDFERLVKIMKRWRVKRPRLNRTRFFFNSIITIIIERMNELLSATNGCIVFFFLSFFLLLSSLKCSIKIKCVIVLNARAYC